MYSSNLSLHPAASAESLMAADMAAMAGEQAIGGRGECYELDDPDEELDEDESVSLLWKHAVHNQQSVQGCCS